MRKRNGVKFGRSSLLLKCPQTVRAKWYLGFQLSHGRANLSTRTRRMRLSQHSDYAFRLLTFVALRDPDSATVGEIAAAFDLSLAHLHKVAQTLAAHGYLDTIRGRAGGVRLA